MTPLATWYVNTKPASKLEDGMLIRGHFGHGQVIRPWLYNCKMDVTCFLCYIFEGHYIFLCIPAKWQRGWLEKLQFRCKRVLSHVWT
jgi:hypothetical protein